MESRKQQTQALTGCWHEIVYMLKHLRIRSKISLR